MKTVFCMKSRRYQRQRGAQLVEFAVVLPVLMLIAMVVLEGGSFIRAHQVINNAAREGAHIASLPESKTYIDAGTQLNALGFAAACKYLNDYKTAFPGWAGDANCGSPFTITVKNVAPGDPAAITINGVNVASSLATISYTYQLKYIPLTFFGWNTASFNLAGRAQFRNFY